MALPRCENQICDSAPRRNFSRGLSAPRPRRYESPQLAPKTRLATRFRWEQGRNNFSIPTWPRHHPPAVQTGRVICEISARNENAAREESYIVWSTMLNSYILTPEAPQVVAFSVEIPHIPFLWYRHRHVCWSKPINAISQDFTKIVLAELLNDFIIPF